MGQRRSADHLRVTGTAAKLEGIEKTAPDDAWHTPCSTLGMLIRSLTCRTGIVPGIALATLCTALLAHPVAAQDTPTNGAVPSATDPAEPAAGVPAAVPPAAPETARADRGALRQTLPDPATSEEVRGQYAWGLMSMIVGGVIVTMALVSLFIFFMRRSWSTSR